MLRDKFTAKIHLDYYFTVILTLYRRNTFLLRNLIYFLRDVINYTTIKTINVSRRKLQIV